MARVLLLLPTDTYRAEDFSAAARTLGAEAVIASERRQAMAGHMGDRAVVVDFADPERSLARIADLHARSPLDAVVAPDDGAVVLGALVAEKLGLRGSPPEAVAATRDKRALREAWQVAGVAQPRFASVSPDGDPRPAVEEVGVPCVVKPVSLSASRGVIRADTVEGAVQAAARARDIAGDPGAPLLVESYLPGMEVAFEGLLEDGRLRALALFDKPDPMEGPYFPETIYVTPSRLPGDVQDVVADTVQRAVAAIGLTQGPVHAELRVDADEARPAMLEVAARPIGGHCSRALRFGLLGASLEEVLLRHALGLPTSGLRRDRDAAGVMMLPVDQAGVLEGVTGQEKARAVPGITGIEITVAPGREIRPLPEGDRYLGFLFARGASPAAVEESLRTAHEHLAVLLT